MQILQDNVMQPLKWCLNSTSAITSRYMFQNASTLVAFFDRQHTNSKMYQQLLHKFWTTLFTITTEDLNQQDVSELYLERVIELIGDLYAANPTLEEHKVKFVEQNKETSKSATDDDESNTQERPRTPKEPQNAAAFRQKELKQLVLQLLRNCIKKTLTLKSSKYIKHIRLLCNMFNDIDFFSKLSENDSLETTLMTFVNLLKSSFLNNEACETVVDVIFEILQHLDKTKRFEYIDKQLMKVRTQTKSISIRNFI